ncbi:hypothetical protein FQA39_LY09948 [Lamprigera yunnana]|nr:hypothetical protein FQA39_LY09948 [Lamprigera yunnana]
MASLVDKLQDLICQIEDCPRCCSTLACGSNFCPPDFPYPQVCMLEPPCTWAPTAPQYVKPLCLPPLRPPCYQPTPAENIKTRKSNFYNYHNEDYHKTGYELCQPASPRQQKKMKCCEDNRRYTCMKSTGCPTGFKICDVKMCPPCNNNPLCTWTATIQPCPTKPRKKINLKYVPEPCRKPCCLHWMPKDGCCNYNAPCKAHCYDPPTRAMC